MASHETASLEMAVTRSYTLAAGGSSRTTEDPVYHVILSTRPGEALDIVQAKLAVDVLVGRERAHGGVNGDLYTLAAHRDDGRLNLVRLRDEKRVVWDLREHRAIDHGYATTSYRSQGRTVDSVFALASRRRCGEGCMST